MARKIPSKADIAADIQELRDELNSKFEFEVDNLQSILEVATPVDTGHLRYSWEDPKEIGPGRFILYNDASYAYQLLMLGRSDNRGSFQLPKGALPLIRKWKKSLGGE